MNLNPFLIEELSSYSHGNEDETEESLSQEQEHAEISIAIDDEVEENICQTQTDIKDIIDSYDRFTPNHIFNLRPNQVFVFGTDKKGSQKYGAAGLASKKFGAQVGVIDGPTGNCYALPTKGFALSDLDKAVIRFIDYVNANSHLTFLVTPVGCGHAGFDVKQVANMFRSLIDKSNVMLPEAFIQEYRADLNKESFKQQTSAIKKQSEVLEKGSDPLESFLSFYDDRLHNVICYLLINKIEFNSNGNFVISDESGTVIAEAELGILSEKVVFFPFNSQSERAFKNNGFVILTPSEYLQSKAK